MGGVQQVGNRVFGTGRRGAWRRDVARRVVAAGLAAGAVLGCLAVARAPEGGETVAVVVAARSLPAGHQLAPGDLVVQERPAAYAPTGPLSSSADLLDRRLAGPVQQGEGLTRARVLGAGLLDGRPPSEVAAHVTVSDPGAAAMVQSGDEVDVLSSTGEVLARGAVVLAVDPGAEAAGALGPTLTPAGSGLVVAVTPEVAVRLAAAPADETGSRAVTVALRPRH